MSSRSSHGSRERCDSSLAVRSRYRIDRDREMRRLASLSEGLLRRLVPEQEDIPR